MANVALVLAAVCLVVGSISRVAGIVTAIAAGLALDFFHTEPLHSLRIHDRDEMLTVALLVLLGGLVSAVTTVRLRRFAHQSGEASRSASRERLEQLLAEGGPAVEIWHAAVDAAAANGLALVDTRPIAGRGQAAPRVARDAESAMFLLPETGATVHGTQATLLLTPRDGIGAVDIDRVAAIAFVDDIDVALRPALPDVHAPSADYAPWT